MKTFVLLFVLLTQFSFAADLPKLQSLFAANFNTMYVPRQCGTNIDKFVKLADKNRIDLTNSYVVTLRNPGFWNLQAFSARGTQPGSRQPWFFHVIFVADNKVLDFDFTNSPKVVPFQTWLKEMFIPKGKIDINYDFRKDLPYFELDFYAAHDFLVTRGITRETPKKSYKLGDLMDLTRL